MTKQELLDNLECMASDSQGEFKNGLLYAIGLIEDGLYYPEQIEINMRGEDEKNSEGFWDLASEIAVAVGLDCLANEATYGETVYAEEWGQEIIYNILTSTLTPPFDCDND